MVRSIKEVLVYGFIIWLIPFIVSFIIYPLKTTGTPLFEAIMPVVIAVTAAMFIVLYFRKMISNFITEGIVTGVAWFLISIITDLLMFSRGPMAMPFAEYMMDIGLTYLIIPAMTVSTGILIDSISKRLIVRE